MVIVPAVPPSPMLAILPLTQTESAAPSDQLAAVVVFQFPEPSFGVAGEVGFASHVTVWPIAGAAASSAAATGATPAASHRALARARARLIDIRCPSCPKRLR